jgi:UV DNA damage endonuclease
VLDFHYQNIIFDADKVREGTKDITELFPAIAETWKRKGIRQEMHYLEPTSAAITPKHRRKHSREWRRSRYVPMIWI